MREGKRGPLRPSRCGSSTRGSTRTTAECETKHGMLARIEREIALDGQLTEAQRAKLLEIANLCPVHRTLTSEIDIRTRLV